MAELLKFKVSRATSPDVSGYTNQGQVQVKLDSGQTGHLQSENFHAQIQYEIPETSLEKSKGDLELELRGVGAGAGKSGNINKENENPNPNGILINVGGSTKRRQLIRSYGGVCLAFLTSILFALDILMAKVLQKYGFFAANSAFYRYVLSPFFSVLFIGFYECRGKFNKNKKSKIFDSIWPLSDPERRKTLILVVIQGVLAPTNIILRHFAVEYIPIGDASVISSSSPILVSVMAYFLLREKNGVVPLLTPVVALVGAIIISKPPILTGAEGFDRNNLIGMAFALGSLICFSSTVIIMRQQKEVHFTLMLLIRSIFGMGGAFLVSHISPLGFSLPHELYASLCLGALAIFSFTNQMIFNLALQMETAALVSLVTSSDSIFTYLAQFVFLGILPDFYSAVGGAVIFLCILTMGFRKYLMEQENDDENGCRKKCFFLLY